MAINQKEGINTQKQNGVKAEIPRFEILIQDNFQTPVKGILKKQRNIAPYIHLLNKFVK